MLTRAAADPAAGGAALRRRSGCRWTTAASFRRCSPAGALSAHSSHLHPLCKPPPLHFTSLPRPPIAHCPPPMLQHPILSRAPHIPSASARVRSVSGLQQLAEVICDSDGTTFVPYGAAPPPSGRALSDAKARVAEYSRNRAAGARAVGSAEGEDSFWVRTALESEQLLVPSLRENVRTPTQADRHACARPALAVQPRARSPVDQRARSCVPRRCRATRWTSSTLSPSNMPRQRPRRPSARLRRRLFPPHSHSSLAFCASVLCARSDEISLAA